MVCAPLKNSIEQMADALVRVLTSDRETLAEFHTWLQAESVRAARGPRQQQEVLLARAAKELAEEAMLDGRKLRGHQSLTEMRVLLEKMLKRNAPASTVDVSGTAREAAAP